MVALSKIRGCAREVAEKFHPQKIVLFGSYAYGEPTRDSDGDLPVAMHSGHAAEQAAAIRFALHPSFPVDVLVRSPGKVRERPELADPFMTTILEQDEVLYEASHA